MRLFFLILLPTLAHALITEDRMDVRIIKVYDKNVLVLNRGLEDDISKGDHIKLTTDDGFIARGLCVRSGMLSSHWKIYRVVKPELVSKDTVFHLNSLNQSEMPEDMEELFARVNFDQQFSDWNEADLQKQLRLQQKRFAKYDFPNSTDGTNIYPEDNVPMLEKIIARNINKKKFIKDMQPLTFTAYASPYSSQSLGNQQSADYGLNIYNKGEKYDLIVNYADKYNKLTDPIQDKSVVQAQRVINAEILIKNFTLSNSWDYSVYAQYDWAKFGGVFTPRRHIKVAPFGARFDLSKSKGKSYSDLTYFLFIDNRIDDKLEPRIVFDPGAGGNVQSGFNVEQVESNRLRHGFRFRLQGMINRNVLYYNELWYQPSMSFAKWQLDTQDVDMHNLFRISVLLGDNFFLDWENHLTHNILLKDNYDLDPTINTNVVHFRYSFDI